MVRKTTIKPAPLVPDSDAWQQVAQAARPLKKPANVVPQPLAPLPRVYKPEGAGAAAYAKAEARQKAPLPHGRHSEKPAPQMDKRLKQRFQRGDLPIDARLDLHGLTLANAERAISKLIRDCVAQQKRCLLVITGKGTSRDIETGPFQGRGVLRAWLPEYLRRGPWRDQILGVTPARQEMGGAGAFYVLLRRQREETPLKR
ncbi:MAG: Smr/MutS family protein [Ferrovibrio sp.]|uniref:Smr/MutS family protein n=1 Tax=Ferrovibrio sp. TaxID=1917215 RepID=UPI002610704B|nr:Smr/MutS family protein [Ferrovibrio sp.]MCW0233073.1 Smr/MutS family protein [Ferrovibrio sp.]